ncbi:efflux RND transporter permease subunit [Maritalea myrionectae]|uniref:Nodulation protein NolG n=1 Tax=Maritalea myrionectae TaxID=454601 RepID=A0A2R4MHH0_9HYPH|nr:efflux RND transporter permease subunit [Maritalea myrionectae]AVX05511.1 nodulation protein NolG [Maritalea myrionectae]
MSAARKNRARSILELFVRHRNAANLLMILMILFGAWGVSKLNRQFFPSLEVKQIQVSMVWSGASADDIRKNMLQAIEPTVRFLDGVRSMSSQAREGSGTISLEFERDTDMRQAEAQVEAAVAGVTNLPIDAETPEVNSPKFFDPIADIGISGPFPEATLRFYAREIRDGLLDAGVDRVTFTGYRDREINIIVDDQKLRQLDLTTAEIAQTISQNTADRPSGSVEGDLQAQIRALAAEIGVNELAKLELKTTSQGDKLLLGDVAQIEDGFNSDQSVGFMGGDQAIRLSVSRSATADTVESFETMNTYLEEIREVLPASLRIEVFNAAASLVEDRLALLVKNGVTGLALVLIVLFIFLDFRIAFWVAVGIPISLLMTLGVMYLTGQTINMISMFALLLTLGIIVDDAIVVGEHTATRYAMGDDRADAAIAGAGRMAAPVIAASLTTMAAFGPILLVGDVVGQILSALPMVVIAVLIASLIECFLVLPGHLSHALPKVRKAPGMFRRNFDRGFDFFKDRIFGAVSRLSYRWRYATTAIAIALAILGGALIPAGKLGFEFFPSVEGETVSLNANFQPGVPQEDMYALIDEMGKVVEKVEKELTPEGETLIVTSFASLDVENGRANIQIYLTPSEQRSVRTREIGAAIRQQLPRFAGVDRIGVREPRGGPPGRAIDVEFTGADTATLKAAAEDLSAVLEGFDGVQDINDTLNYGKPELVLELTPRGSALGFNIDSLGSQIRDAFEGRVARRVAAEDEEITIRVERDGENEGTSALRNLWVRSPAGNFVPLLEVVDLSERQGFNRIVREEGKTTVRVIADTDNNIISGPEVITRLEQDYMGAIVAEHGVNYSFGGTQAEQNAAFGDLRLGGLIALGIMYVIIAWIFASYFAPLAVMLIIPFGVVGAIWGHFIMGYSLTIISVMGLLGLAGILVNDSIVLVSRLQERLEEGDSLYEAATGASRDRLRAVLLTSLTTIGGLTPLLFETSLQAQFLIPMAITIVFGLGLATALVLFLVPAFIGIGADIGAFFGWLFLRENAPSFRGLLLGHHHTVPRRTDPAE